MDELERCHSYAWAASQAREVAQERGRAACVVNLRAHAAGAGTGAGAPACCLAAARRGPASRPNTARMPSLWSRSSTRTGRPSRPPERHKAPAPARRKYVCL